MTAGGFYDILTLELILTEVQMLYFITVTAATLIITALNFLLNGEHSLPALGKLLLFVIVGVAAEILIDGVAAFVIRRLPEKWFSPEAKAFTVGKRERNFYRKSKIGVWKKYIPEWGCFTGFHKDKLREPNDSAYIGRFLLESNYGVAGHIAGAFLGFTIIFLPFLHPLTAALPIALVNFVLSILPTMILRSNTPALRGLYRRNKEKEEKKARALDDAKM